MIDRNHSDGISPDPWTPTPDWHGEPLDLDWAIRVMRNRRTEDEDCGAPVDLEEADDPEFSSAEVIYSGSDAARVMSGKPDGVYYYRVRDTARGSESNAVEVTVRHHGLGRALAFFGLGATVFLATLLLIATAARDSTGER